MRSSNDPINGLKQRLIDWNILSEDELKKIDKDIRKSVDQAVEEAKASPEPEAGDEMWKDIYFSGTAPPYMRGREAEEIHYYKQEETQGKPAREVVSVAQLGSNSQTDEAGRLV